jgi:proteasome accessory factor A
MSKQRYNFEDFSSGVPARVFGSETEYTSQAIPSNTYGGQLDDHIPSELYISPGRKFENGNPTSKPKSKSAVLKNGSEIYFDENALIEYATAECLTPYELLLQERAGERIVEDVSASIACEAGTNPAVYKRTGYAERTKDKPEDVYVKPISTGHHENYLSYIGAGGLSETQGYMLMMASYLATRSVWSGTGMIAADGFVTSQKQPSLSYARPDSKVTDGKKMFASIKQDRIEIRSGEGNLSDWAIMQKYALTSLALRLIEQEVFDETVQLVDPDGAALAVAQNPYTNITLASGAKISAIDHQARIFNRAMERFGDAVPDYEKLACQNFDTFRHDFKQTSLHDSDVSLIADRVDWAAKFAWFKSHGISAKQMTNRDLLQVKYDLSWERLDDQAPGRAWFQKMGRHVLTSETIRENLDFIPHTRAVARVREADLLNVAGNLEEVKWGSIKEFGEPATMLGDPFDASPRY